MSYKPRNLADFKDDSSDYPKGSATGKGGGVVPGTTGSSDRDSQPKDFIGGGQRVAQPDFALADGGMNDRLNPRSNPTFGKRSYDAAKPSIMEGD